MPESLTQDQELELAERFAAGDPTDELAADFGVFPDTVRSIAKKHRKKRPRPPIAIASGIKEFAKRARSILWRQDSGTEKKTYEKWKERLSELQSSDGANMSYEQAVVRTSKEFPCLIKLFREYDVREFDPNPESHPEITYFGKATVDNADIECEGVEQSYRDSLRWAIAAAGRYLRTRKHPETCPCDAAFYLYRQAIEEPKDFMGKVGQIESKADSESEAINSARKVGKRAILEIDAMLAELDEEGDEE